ncbi:MAG: hypothetical protein IJP17_00245 [Clostridia bacterium]|nr:hypothetical protein [Clostridia bacterium]
MNDYFILSNKEISFGDFRRIVQSIPECKTVSYEDAQVIQVWCNGKHIDFTAMCLEEFSCVLDQDVINSKNIKSIFMISCHDCSKSELDFVVNSISTSLTGWLGQDTDGFAPLVQL